MKVHVGADVDSGAVHSVEITAANEADINVLPKLLRAEDEVIFCDAGYTSDEYKRGSRQLGIRCCVQDKRSPDRISRRARRAKPEVFLNLGTGGTCIPGDQAAVWIYPDPLPRTDEECCPGEQLMGLVNLYLLRRRLLTTWGGRISSKCPPPKADDEPQTEGIRQQNPAEK